MLACVGDEAIVALAGVGTHLYRIAYLGGDYGVVGEVYPDGIEVQGVVGVAADVFI